MDRAATKPWFRDTVFVIVADHCASSAGKTDLPVEKYLIPAIVYAPAHIQPAEVTRLASQIDIAPTLLGLLKFKYRSRFMGYDLFDLEPGRERAFISTYQDLGFLQGIPCSSSTHAGAPCPCGSRMVAPSLSTRPCRGTRWPMRSVGIRAQPGLTITMVCLSRAPCPVPMRVLLVEDDELLGHGVQQGLIQHGFAVDWVQRGDLAESALLTQVFDCVVLDWQLPGLSGVALLQRLRARGNHTPVMMLTARDALEDRIEGLDGGADDYLVKPVAVVELAARLRALIRRASGQGSPVFTWGAQPGSRPA